MSEQLPKDTSAVLTRALFMLLFAVIWGVAEMVLGAVAIIQLVLLLVSKQANAQLLKFGRSLSEYLYQIARFQTFASEEKPFPFSDWPAENSTAGAGAPGH